MDDAVVIITPTNKGPNIIKGRIRIQTPSGKILKTNEITALCRCGHSNDKPFCDGSHARVGFSAVEGGPDFHKEPE